MSVPCTNTRPEGSRKEPLIARTEPAGSCAVLSVVRDLDSSVASAEPASDPCDRATNGKRPGQQPGQQHLVGHASRTRVDVRKRRSWTQGEIHTHRKNHKNPRHAWVRFRSRHAVGRAFARSLRNVQQFNSHFQQKGVEGGKNYER